MQVVVHILEVEGVIDALPRDAHSTDRNRGLGSSHCVVSTWLSVTLPLGLFGNDNTLEFAARLI